MNKEYTKEEIWKAIKGYEGYYEVSSTGQVRSVDRIVDGPRNAKYHIKGIVLKQRVNKGYYVVNLKRDGGLKHTLVHRAVAETFIPNPLNLPEVNHIDGNKLNNNIENLEWVTKSQNVRHAVKTGLIKHETLVMNSLVGADKVSIPILCVDSGEVFSSKLEACSRLNITYDCLQNALDNEPHVTDRGHGFHVEEISKDTYKELIQSQKSSNKYDTIYHYIRNQMSNSGKAMRIYCIEQDRYYDSLSDAGRKNNMHYSTIALAIKENRKCKGLTFIEVRSE